MPVEEFNIKFWPKQGEALKYLSYENPVEVLGYGGGKGGGKSHLGRMWLVARCLKYAKSRALLIRESFPELERTHIDRLKMDLPKSMYDYTDKGHKFTFRNDSTLEMGYCESAEDVKSTYWGAEYDCIVLDEAQNHPKDTFKNLYSCLRKTRPDLKAKLLLTFNWGSIGHAWLLKMFWRKWMSKYKKIGDELDTWEHNSHWDFEMLPDGKRMGECPENFAFVKALLTDNPSIIENDPTYATRLQLYSKEIREAYIEGEPMGLEGQFFTEFGPHLKESPFDIQESELMTDNFFGGLDSGTTHPTIFGLYWLSGPAYRHLFGNDWVMHRLMTYKAAGSNIRAHAQEVFSRIEAFPFTHGHFPHTIAYDNQLDVMYKANEYVQVAGINEYKDVFQGKRTLWVPANKDKINGCQILRMMFSSNTTIPAFRYWDVYNKTFEEDIVSVIKDKNNTEVYAKADGDDDADQTRYAAMYGRALIANKKLNKNTTDKIKQHNAKMASMDWRDL